MYLEVVQLWFYLDFLAQLHTNDKDNNKYTRKVRACRYIKNVTHINESEEYIK